MDARGPTPFEQAVATAYTTRLGLGGSTFHLAESPAGEAETVFLGVFRKEALLAVGGFDETMHRAQDWELNYRLRQSGRTIWFSPDLRVTYRPRSSLRALVKQMYETGKWRREVVRRYPETANAALPGPAGGRARHRGGTADRPARAGHWLPAAPGGLRRPAGYLALVLGGSVGTPPLRLATRLRCRWCSRDAHGLGPGLLYRIAPSSPFAPPEIVTASSTRTA